MKPIQDLGLLLLCSLRYAMGRKSYVTSSIAETIEYHWDDLNARDHMTILADLRGELERAERAGQFLGMEMDHKMWRDTYNRLTNRTLTQVADSLADKPDSGV